MAWRRLRSREEVNRLLMPLGLEGTRRVLDQAHAEEPIARLDGRREDAYICEYAAEEYLTDTALTKALLEVGRRERAKGPLVDDNLAREGCSSKQETREVGIKRKERRGYATHAPRSAGSSS